MPAPMTGAIPEIIEMAHRSVFGATAGRPDCPYKPSRDSGDESISLGAAEVLCAASNGAPWNSSGCSYD